MPNQSIIEVVRPLLVQLEATSSIASKYGSDQISDEIKGVVEDINSLKQKFQKLEIWEKDKKDEFAKIAREIDKALEAGNDENELANKITELANKITDVREATSEVEKTISDNSPLLQKRLDDYYDKSLSNTTPSVDNADDAQDCQFVTIESIPEISTFGPMLAFLCIFPDYSWIKIKRVVYPWWIFHGYGLMLESLDLVLEMLEAKRYIKCKFKEYNSKRVDQCMLNPSAKKAFMKLVGADVRKMYDQKLVDPNLICTCLSPSYRIGHCINVNNDYLQPGGEFFDNIDFVFMMFGKWHNSVKDHHIEVANDEFVKWLTKFKSLKYLNLSGISRILKLPPEIGNLRRLRFLDLRACYDLQTLPEITTLPFLKYLDISECHFLTHMPRGIDTLKSLQVLKGFIVDSIQRSDDTCKLGDLSKLEYLDKLSLVIGRNSILDLKEFSKLSKLESLRLLTITWAEDCSQTNNEDATLPPNLEKLDLRCFREKELPTWLVPNKLNKLERLYIRGGKVNVAKLWGPGNKWSNEETGVKVLRLRFLQEVEAMDREKEIALNTAFPRIEYVEFYNCNNFQLNYRWKKQPTSV